MTINTQAYLQGYLHEKTASIQTKPLPSRVSVTTPIKPRVERERLIDQPNERGAQDRLMTEEDVVEDSLNTPEKLKTWQRERKARWQRWRDAGGEEGQKRRHEEWMARVEAQRGRGWEERHMRPLERVAFNAKWGIDFRKADPGPASHPGLRQPKPIEQKEQLKKPKHNKPGIPTPKFSPR